jgi:ABC-type multidrug transport system permease subunit
MFISISAPSTTFGTSYYDVFAGGEASTWDAYQAHRLDGVWVIPVDFSERIQAGDQPFFEMHFNNDNDDRAKNHRIYAAEILWHFYEKIGYPEPPLRLEETYPRSKMIEWLPVIAVGVALLSFILGAMMNIFMLTHKEQLTKVTLEFGLTPRSLVWVLLPKTILALIMGLATGTVFLGIIYLLMGAWPGKFIFAVWLVAGLVCLFWIPLVMLAGLRKLHFFAGAVVTILTGMTIFFIGGGLALVRPFKEKVTWISWLFPNIYAVDPLRDMILFQAWPTDWNQTITILSVFALFSIVVGWFLANRQLRKLG